MGPEHPGRTRGVGHTVGLRVGLSIDNNKRKNKDNSDLKEEIRDLRAQIQQQKERAELEKKEMEDLSKREKREWEERAEVDRREWQERIKLMEQMVFSRKDATLVERSGLLKSHVGSSACTPHLSSIEHATPCDLLFGFKKAKTIVAKGFVFPLANNIVHGVPLEEGFIKVSVELVMDGCEGFPLPVPLTNDNIIKLGDALNKCIQWDQEFLVLQPELTTTNKRATSDPARDFTKVSPRNAPIPPKVQKDQEAHSKRVALASGPKRKPQTVTNLRPLSKEDSMMGLHRRLHSNKQWVKNGVTAQVDVAVFGSTDFHIAVKYSDLEDLMTNGWLDQNVLTWFLAYT